jgi:hypothetical protein
LQIVSQKLLYKSLAITKAADAAGTAMLLFLLFLLFL